ncbi:MAG: beta-lactamase family protein [Verrucomicrobiae bacterium]|nr:beta-lactamase family protein [Verrucomicrobiae bacterium]MDW8308567.1 serine hydrolase domain-containing protein [Verrucomicrobiales bacterium]
MKFLQVLWVAGALTTPAGAAAPESSPLEQAGAALIAAREKFDIVGLSVGALHHGRLLWQTNLGYADLERHIPLSPQTKFRIASISKLVTATALMQLWERGRLKLDDPVGDVLGYPVVNPHHPDRPITFRHLLTHRAGFRDGPAYDDFLMFTYHHPQAAPGFQELLCPGGSFYRDGAVYSTNAPGSRYAYSNLGFGLLGTLVEKISGERFDEYCARRIFRPLRMSASFNPATLPRRTRLAVLYRPATNGWEAQFDNYGGATPTNRLGPGYKIGHNALPCAPQGGLRANVQDLARFVRVFIQPEHAKATGVLQPATVAVMLGRAAADGGEAMPLAFHRTSRLVSGETWIGHTGSAYGMNGLLFFQDNGPMGVIVLTNGSRPGEEQDGFSPMERELVSILRRFLRSAVEATSSSRH